MKTDKKLKLPTFIEEKTLINQGYQLIAGVDETGRGPLAGPVVAAAVILPFPLKTKWLNSVRDSKQLNQTKREYLFHCIHEKAISIGVGMVSAEVIDKQGIAKSSRVAMKIAVEQLSPPPQFLLLDYFKLPELPYPQNGIVHGDTICFSIACASIIAKVSRDQVMVELDKTYPGYGLADHKGYGTKEHLSCLYRLGPSPVHRLSFRPVNDINIS